jgi:MoaA/NifB/PqqE/SkfB family radical SAM enzyme
MKATDILRAARKILAGQRPSLSIEITRECPLRCPGCYAYDPAHLGGGQTLRDLSDYKGQELIDRVLAIADRLQPLHISLVGGDPLVRYREVEALVPQLLARGIHVQVVTSAFRPMNPEWAGFSKLKVVVSIDGLRPEHDRRRSPATYGRILNNIANQRVTIHCTITSQMMKRPNYLRDFLDFWTTRPEVRQVWFSIFTPQRGEFPEERLTPEERRRAIADLSLLRPHYPKLDMPPGVIRQFAHPPKSPDECIFAQANRVLSADLRTEIGPCQFGGNPDCDSCGCIASMGMAAIGNHKLGGLIPLRAIFRAATRIGRLRAAQTPLLETPSSASLFHILPD